MDRRSVLHIFSRDIRKYMLYCVYAADDTCLYQPQSKEGHCVVILVQLMPKPHVGLEVHLARYATFRGEMYWFASSARAMDCQHGMFCCEDRVSKEGSRIGSSSRLAVENPGGSASNLSKWRSWFEQDLRLSNQPLEEIPTVVTSTSANTPFPFSTSRCQSV